MLFARLRWIVLLALLVLVRTSLGAQQTAARPWSAEGELGGTLFFGNRSSLTAATRLAAGWTDSTREVSVDASFGYGLTTDRDGDTFVSKRSWTVGSAYDHHPLDAWAPFAFVRLEGSYELRVDNRYDVGAGAKYTFLRTEDAKADVSGALLVERIDPAGPDAGNDALVRWSVRLRGRRSPGDGRIALESEVFVRPLFSHPSEFTLTSTSAAGLMLTDRITFKVSLVENHDSGAKQRGARSNHDGQLLLSVLAAL